MNRIYNPDGFNLSILSYFDLTFFEEEVNTADGGAPIEFMREYNAMPWSPQIVAWGMHFIRTQHKFRMRFWLWSNPSKSHL